MTTRESLAKPQILRLAHKAGVKTVNALVYENVRDISKSYLEGVLKQAIVIMEARGAKTISQDDMEKAIEYATGVRITV